MENLITVLLVSLPCVLAILPLPNKNIANISNGKVFYLTGRDGVASIHTKEAAHAHCAQYGASVAYAHELYEAMEAGLSKCRCGFLDEDQVSYPMLEPHPRCDSGQVGVLTCPKESYKWQKDGWDVYCFILGPGHVRRQAPDGAMDIGPGWVFHHESLDGERTITDLTEAARQCKMKGGVVASWYQLKQAQLLGFTSCQCGWLQGREVAYSKATSLDCSAECEEPTDADVIACPSDVKKWASGYDVYCYRPKDFNKKPPKPPGQPVPGGYIFPVDGRNGKNSIKCRREAEDLCDMHGATLASAAEYYTAYISGQLQDCNCAYLRDGISYSVSKVGQCKNGMDDSLVGVFSCTENWSNLGFNGYRAYCFIGDQEKRKTSDETAIPIPGGYVFLHANVDRNRTLTGSREANVLCQGRGGQLANKKQLKQAMNRGMTQCVCGWLKDSAAYPLHQKLAYCGNEVGLIECPLAGMGPTWGAYCFQPVRLTCERRDPKEIMGEIFQFDLSIDVSMDLFIA